MLVTGNRRVELLQHNLHTAVAVHKTADVVHHGGLTEYAGTLVRRPEVKHNPKLCWKSIEVGNLFVHLKDSTFPTIMATV